LKQPFAAALDPIPHKFKFIPPFVFDMIGLTINRDEVRTPMQWDGTKNAGFSSAEKTWLPVHGNYKEINVEEEYKDANSLLNTIRALMKIRNEETSLQEGTLEILDGLPNGVFGYSRNIGKEKISVLLNFDNLEKKILINFSTCLFKLSDRKDLDKKTVHLNGLDGVILKISTTERKKAEEL